VVELHEF